MFKNKKGFTLIELSVIAVIFALILAGLLRSNKYFLQQNKETATKNKIKAIQVAINNYLLLNHYLPCPADVDNTSGTEGTCDAEDAVMFYGVDDEFVYGAVPVTTLNLDTDMMKDEWGNKFSYIVDAYYTEHKDAVPTGFVNMNPEDSAISVYSEGTGAGNLITDKAVYAIISHGENGIGAFNYVTGTQSSTTGSSTEEDKNIAELDFDGTIVNTLYSENFDDIVYYKTKKQLIMDLDWKDVGCYIDMTVLNANEPDALCDDLSGNPASTYLDYYEEYGEQGAEDWTYNTDDQTNCCIAKCYKYGRVGYYLKGEDCD